VCLSGKTASYYRWSYIYMPLGSIQNTPLRQYFRTVIGLKAENNKAERLVAFRRYLRAVHDVLGKTACGRNPKYMLFVLPPCVMLNLSAQVFRLVRIESDVNEEFIAIEMYIPARFPGVPIADFGVVPEREIDVLVFRLNPLGHQITLALPGPTTLNISFML
jgi:hypothetical protein